jgi:hypothetical protein
MEILFVLDRVYLYQIEIQNISESEVVAGLQSSKISIVFDSSSNFS